MKCLLPCCLFFAAFLLASASHAQVLITEIMYHPVEEPAFKADGTPVLDLYDDVHEFIELYNGGTTSVSLANWELTGGVNFVFPASAVIQPDDYIVVAKNPERLLAVPAYSLSNGIVFGPWMGNLSNESETIRLRNGTHEVVESVTYSSSFPWPIGANALGAGQDWTGLKELDYQYRGRSLERVSFTASADDPANWLASPVTSDPTPGGPNHISLRTPKPVVVQLRVSQASNGHRLIRRNEPARIECLFSDVEELSEVKVEYFVDSVELTNEVRTAVSMLEVGNAAQGQFMVDLPGLPDRSVVRYRIRANRGGGDKVVSPRSDDPFGWHAYFVSPVRPSLNPSYDAFISANSLRILRTNISSQPRRVINPDPPGKVRASWNATQPAILVHDGLVYEVQMRYHGSRYRRDPNRQSYKVQFPRFQRFNDHGSVFITDKDYQTAGGHAIFRAAGLPTSLTRSVDLYLNNAARLVRLEQEEYDDDMLERYRREQELLHPDEPQQDIGELYKCVGFDGTAEGPYGNGNGRLLPARSPHWTALQRYEWTYALQDHGWRGHTLLKEMVDGMWAARGNSAINTNSLRAYYPQYWDLDRQLTHLALSNWMVPWDDVFQNYFLWQQRNGKWSQLPWDFDNVMNGQPAATSIFNASPNQTPANFFKTSFIAVFRDDFRKKMWFMNNTLLHPDNLAALGVASQIRNWSSNRFRSVNTQCALGVFQRPNKPTNQVPALAQLIGPVSLLQASEYSYSTNPIVPHASTTWLIRPANGTYYTPVFQFTSSNQLTALSAPGHLLQLGQTYFWKCIYTDTDGHPSVASTETSFSVGAARNKDDVALNEIMADNVATLANGGKFPDWIELYNPADQPQSLLNVTLTDDLLVPDKFRFPPGANIPAHGYLIVWCDDAIKAPGFHTGFGLNADGQTIGLYFSTGNGWVLKEVVAFGPQLADLSIGRFANGSGEWTLNVPTPNASNNSQALGSSRTLKINEWMANPTSGEDWFEIYNPDPLPVALAGLGLTDTFDKINKSPFPPLSFVAGRGFSKILADDQPGKGGNHVTFHLSAQSGTIGLFNTNGTLVDSVFYAAQPAGVSRGRVPDGAPNIYSLGLKGTPGKSNFLDSNGDGLPDAWELAHGLDPFSRNNAPLDSDSDGLTNVQEFSSGTNPQEAESKLRIDSVQVAEPNGGTFLIRFKVEPGKSYTVQYREGVELDSWQKLQDIPAQSARQLIEIGDLSLRQNSTRYYRVVTPNQP